MKLHVFEATNGFNWGKFAVARFEDEWRWRSGLAEVARRITDEELGDNVWEEVNDHNPARHLRPLLAQLGWGREHTWVFDLQTGEAALFRPGGLARADLQRHAIWVCPLFEPFLTWLYTQDLADLSKLPHVVELPEAPAELYGYRRPGPDGGKSDRELAIAGVLHDLECSDRCTPTVYPQRIWDAVDKILDAFADPALPGHIRPGRQPMLEE